MDKSISKNPATKALLFPAVNAVFQPSAEVLGGELKEWVENKIAEKKRARIQEHTEKAKTDSISLQNPEINSERQISNFEVWVENVGNVHPDDPIAKAWQSILEDIINDDPEVEIVINALKSLSSEEAAYFVEYMRGDVRHLHPDKNRCYLDGLKEKGVVAKGIDSIFMDVALSLYRPLGIDIKRNLGAKYQLTWIGEELAKRLG